MRAIKRSQRHEEMVRQLAEAPHPTIKRQIFPSMRDLVCFAAVLGFEKDQRKPLDAQTHEIDSRIFENSQQAIDMIFLIALAGAKDAEILREGNEDQAVHVFEEYAEGGLQVLASWLKEKPEDPLGNQAVIAALANHGFLQLGRDVDSAKADISFA